MDEAVALVLAAPVVALALWAVAFTGSFSNAQARSAVAAELAAQAAADARGSVPDAAERVALGATLSACAQTGTSLNHIDTGQSAAVTVACEVPGPPARNRVCFAGYAQHRPAVSTHVRVACPTS